MRVLFAGTPDIAVPTLAALVDAGVDVPLVVTQPDARGRRGSRLWPSPVKEFALERGLEVAQPERASEPEFVARVAELRADAAAVVAYGQILRPELLAAVRTRWVNLHFSLLPRWRGAAPVQRAIMAGDSRIGATTFAIEEGLDTGPIIDSVADAIRPDDTAGSLLARLSQLGAPLMLTSVGALHDGSAILTPQVEDGATYAAKLDRDDAYVAWASTAAEVDWQVRGCTPAPGAWTTLPDGTTARIGPVRPRPEAVTSAPGTVRADGGSVLVSCGEGCVELSTIAPAGKREMPAEAWLRGARLGEGAQLGEA